MAEPIAAPSLEAKYNLQSTAADQLKAQTQARLNQPIKLQTTNVTSGVKGGGASMGGKGAGAMAWGQAIGDSLNALASMNSNDKARRNGLKNDALMASQNMQRANLNTERVNFSAAVTPAMAEANEEDKLQNKPIAGIPQQVTNRPANMMLRPQPTSIARKGTKLIKRP